MSNFEAELNQVANLLSGRAYRSAVDPAWTDARRKAEQMITLLNKGDRAGAEKLAGSWTDSERRAVQAELDRL